MNLLPEVDATVTPKGLLCEGLYYTCDLARPEEWFERARETNCQKVKLARDPRDITRAYLRLDGGRRMEVCELVEADHAFVGKDWYEQAEEFEGRKQRSDKAKFQIIDNTAELNAYADDVIKSAKQRTKDHQREMNNRARVGGIRKNRKLEKDLERKSGAWVLGTDPAANTPDSISETLTVSNPMTGYVAPAQPMHKLRLMREGESVYD